MTDEELIREEKLSCPTWYETGCPGQIAPVKSGLYG